MNFDKNSLNKLRSLSDEELIKVLKDIAAEAGIDSENFKIGKSDLMKIRVFLSVANDDDIAQLITRFGGQK